MSMNFSDLGLSDAKNMRIAALDARFRLDDVRRAEIINEIKAEAAVGNNDLYFWKNCGDVQVHASDVEGLEQLGYTVVIQNPEAVGGVCVEGRSSW